MKKNMIAWLALVVCLSFFTVAFAAADTLAADDVAVNPGAAPSGEKGNMSFDVLSPQAEMKRPSKLSVINPRVTDLSDKNIGLIWCGKAGGEYFLEATAELLRKKYPLATISQYTWGLDNAKEKVSQKVDTFIYGVGDSSTGAWESTARTIQLEKLGKPGVVVFSEHLMSNGEASALAQGMPSVRMVTVPSLEYYTNRSSVENIRPCAAAVFGDIIDALTRPVQPSDEKTGLGTGETISDIVRIAADDLESAYEKFYQLFMDNEWGDGLPLAPPTPKNVKRMLKGTKLPPDTILGTISSPDSHAGIADVTVEKVAINAVMAGAKPEYLPVIIAAMEGLSDKDFITHVFSSGGSFTLLIAVTGPIAKRINMHSGIGLLGHGWRANNTIGRAVRLCMNNIGNFKPGKADMALIGRPSSHTFYVLAENDDLNPWGPYHTIRGYSAEESYVTVSSIGGNLRIYGGGSSAPWTVEGVLNEIVKDIASNRIMFSSFSPGRGVGVMSQPRKHIIVLHPEMAIVLNNLGFSRQGLLNHLIDRTSVPYEELSEQEILGIEKRLSLKSEAFFGSANIPDDRAPMIREALKPGGKVPIVISPEDIHIFVSGGISSYSFGSSYLRAAHMIKPVR